MPEELVKSGEVDFLMSDKDITPCGSLHWNLVRVIWDENTLRELFVCY